MATQFGIIDDQGQLFGLRGTTYTSYEAAEKALDFLREHRREMERQAHQAAERLERTKGSDETTIAAREQMKELIARWEAEKQRSYDIKRREVSPWTPV